MYSLSSWRDLLCCENALRIPVCSDAGVQLFAGNRSFSPDISGYCLRSTRRPVRAVAVLSLPSTMRGWSLLRPPNAQLIRLIHLLLGHWQFGFHLTKRLKLRPILTSNQILRTGKRVRAHISAGGQLLARPFSSPGSCTSLTSPRKPAHATPAMVPG